MRYFQSEGEFFPWSCGTGGTDEGFKRKPYQMEEVFEDDMDEDDQTSVVGAVKGWGWVVLT